jgi:RNA polymerase sigma factor (sigma-70 family)
MVLGLCRLLLRDPVEADDAAQQVFLSAHQAILRGSPPRDQAAWMAAIARNECRARIRARMREPLELPELPSDLPDPLAAAIRAADLQAVWIALGELPRRQRNALVLRELSGLSYHELGRALGVSQSAVESLLFRARQQVRAFVGGANARFAAVPVALKIAGAAASIGIVATGASGLQPIRLPHVAAPPHHVQVRVTAVPPPRLPRLVEVHEVSPAPVVVRHQHRHHEVEHAVQRHEQSNEGPGTAPTTEPAQLEASHEGPGDGVSSSGHDGPDGSSGSDGGSGSDHSGPG